MHNIWEDELIMKRVNDILFDNEFRENLKKIDEFEKNRIYCCHGMNHLLDVARIASIRAVDEELDIDRDIIYVTALLHDIGRVRQYEYGEDHDKAGVVIAESILGRYDFTTEEIVLITSAIAGHRGEDNTPNTLNDAQQSTSDVLKILIKTADNESRLCFLCEAEDTCKWSDSRKNRQLII